jgi:DNA (cytosine-5)-methyltransferase 1
MPSFAIASRPSEGERMIVRVADLPQYALMDLFAGCGGMTSGFLASRRFRPVCAIESDDRAAATYAVNFGSHVMCEPIEKVKRFPNVDVVIGGPPCQAFSLLNRRMVGFERRALWRHYARALRESGASTFVMENVPQLLMSPEFRSFSRSAKRAGFQIDARVLNAADYGVPQKRLRAFVIGSRVGTFNWPDATHVDPRSKSSLPPWRTFREAVAGLSVEPSGRNWHVGRNPRPETVLRYRAVPSDGGNRFQMQANLDANRLGHLVQPCFRRKPTGTTDVFGRLWWDRPAVTIRTEFVKPEKGRYLHPSADRSITPREAARCMSFPDGFVFPEEQSMTAIARQIGNAVPPLLAAHVAVSIAALLDGASCSALAA